VAQKTDPSADLNWLLDDLVSRIKEAEHAIVLSADGLLMAASEEIDHEDAEYLSAVAAGIQSLAKGVGERFDGGSIRQTIVEMRSAYLLVMVAGHGACLAVLSTEDADIGLIAYEMAMLVSGLGHHLTAAKRSREADEQRTA
jgi:predicted regulator of Ras-like GTPase activity (Roadblock/LC7/MglB family)